MPSLKSKIESMLLVTNYPLTEKKLLELTQEKDKKKISEAVTELYNDYKQRSDSGIVLVKTDDSVQLVTAPDNAGVVAKFIKDETTGELSRASLETLTIIAYRSPITRAELETIRGVNCSVILRNLSIRGLVESVMDKKKMATTYFITIEFMKFLGITDPKELPDYEKLNSDENLQKVISENKKD